MRVAYGRLGVIMFDVFVWVVLVLLVRHFLKPH